MFRCWDCSRSSGVFIVCSGSGRKILGAIMQTGLMDVFAVRVSLLCIVCECVFLIVSICSSSARRRQPTRCPLIPHPSQAARVPGLDTKNPAIICPSANADVAVAEAVSGSLSFNGRRCTALKMSLASLTASCLASARPWIRKERPSPRWQRWTIPA